MLVNASFFTGDITIANTDDNRVIERLSYFIEQEEEKCLSAILGYRLYKLLSSETSTRIQELIDGADYTDYYGNLQRWKGIVHGTVANQSLVADYIYTIYQADAATQTTGVSTATSLTDGGLSVSPADKILNAWNKFSNETHSLISFLWNKNNKPSVTPVYPEWTVYQRGCAEKFSRKNNYLGI